MQENFNQLTVLLVDGCDRQTLPLARAFHELGCTVATLNSSKLDNGYTSKYVDQKYLNKDVRDNKLVHINTISTLIKSKKFDVVVTTSDDTAEQLSLIKSDIENNTDTKIAVVDPELFYMAYNKNQTMQICMENDIPCPKTILGVKNILDMPFKDIRYPVVVKPCKSFGAIGYKKVDTEEDLRSICNSLGNEIEQYVFQEYIPQTDIQYECAMFVDENNEIKTACVFSKNRWFPVSGGSSTCNVTVDRPDIIESCTKLLQTIHWRGAADIDLIQDPRDGIAKIMEINPRVSGSVKIVLNSGVNIARQILELATGRDVSEYLAYKKDTRLRCMHTDLLWFIKSPNRMKSSPSWFSWKNTSDQIWSWRDPLPFFTFSLQGVFKYKKEMKKREH